MADDYKHMVPPAEKTGSHLPLLAALLPLAAAAGAGAALWFTRPMADTPAPVAAITPAAESAQPPGNVPDTTQSPEDATGTEKPAGTQPLQNLQQPLDFYTVLPQMEVPVIPQSTPARKDGGGAAQTRDTSLPGQPETTARTEAAEGLYYLQIGSFQNEDAARRLVQQVRALGLKTSMQQVTLINNGLWYRVHVGPFPDFGSSSPAQRTLDRESISYTLMKQIAAGQDARD